MKKYEIIARLGYIRKTATVKAESRDEALRIAWGKFPECEDFWVNEVDE